MTKGEEEGEAEFKGKIGYRYSFYSVGEDL
jgi:hypothetical protein